MFEELTLIIVITAVISYCLRLLKQPTIIGYVLAGVIVGPAVLNIYQSADTLHVFAEFGIALLLFIMGLSLNINIIKDVGKVAGIASVVQLLFVSSVTFATASALGYSRNVSAYVAVALSLSSTIIVVKLLSDKKEQTRLYAKIAIGFLIIQDFLATVAVLLVSSSNKGSINLDSFISLSTKGGLLLVAMLTFRYLLLPKLNNIVSQNQEFLFLFAISMALGIASLSKSIGLSIEIGALLGGMTLASMPYAMEVANRLKPLRDFFLVLHFVLLGALINPENLQDSPSKIIIFSLIVLISNPVAILIIMGLMGYTKKVSFKTGIAMTQVGEFSLILLAVANAYGYIDKSTISMVTTVALITISVSTYMIMYSDQLYKLFEKYLKLFERRKAIEVSEKRRKRYEAVLFGYQRGGHEFLSAMQKISKKNIVVDYDPNVIDFLTQKNIEFMYGDATDIDLLEELNIKHSKLIISTITDTETNKILASWLKSNKSSASLIVSADNAEEAGELYELGAAYVILPHYIGSEKISTFIKRGDLSKTSFKEYKEKHLKYLQTHSNDLVENVTT